MSKEKKLIFYLSAASIAALTGFLIPASVLSVSAMEFISVENVSNPLGFLVRSSLYAAGFFFIWPVVFFGVSTPNIRRVMSEAAWIMALLSVVNFALFGRRLGFVSSELVFDKQPEFSVTEILINTVVMIFLAVAAHFLYTKKTENILTVLAVELAAIVFLGAFFSWQINDGYKNALDSVEEIDNSHIRCRLSKTGKNVIVVMMDRAAAQLVPFMINEKPELKQQLDGFVFYPDTVSFGTHTNTGNMELYGGYDYTPEEVNKRDTERLVDKQNEALKVMPTLFSDAGFDVTVFDPTYADYRVIPNTGIFDDIKNVNAYITMGNFNIEEDRIRTMTSEEMSELERNLFAYGIMKGAPVLLQNAIYDMGEYNSSHSLYADENIALERINDLDNISKDGEVGGTFLNAYRAMEALPEMTDICDDGDHFLMMSNDLTHSVHLLKEPEYIAEDWVDNTEYDRTHMKRYDAEGNYITLDDRTKMCHYHVNMAMLLLLGKWCDYMKQQGVYDNTRIIITSDHAINLYLENDIYVPGKDYESGKEQDIDIRQFNCLLMEKDFNATGFRVDDSFMTNADVPAMALEGVADSAVNPFTGNPVDVGEEIKKDRLMLLDTDPVQYADRFTHQSGAWFSVTDSIFDPGNWKFEGIR